MIATAAIWLRGSGITSRRKAWPLEATASPAARRYLIPSNVRRAANPVPPTQSLTALAAVVVGTVVMAVVATAVMAHPMTYKGTVISVAATSLVDHPVRRV